MSIEALTRTVLFSGFTLGKWTVTLMMLMHKPLMLALIAIAHRAGLKHVPVVLPQSFNKYHLDKLKQHMMTQKIKQSNEKSKDVPPSQQLASSTPPQQINNGFIKRQP
jgi:hypothetical protein